jgi:hypothetical protein
MADPESALKDLPPESPPPEIVLAAVRVFRYRALAVVALGVALVIGAVFVYQRINVEGQFSVKVATARVQGGTYFGKGIGEIHTIDGISVVVWEVVGDGIGAYPQVLYVHLVGWDPKGRQVEVEMANPKFGGEPARVTGLEGGGNWGGSTTLLDLWIGLETSGSGPLTFEAQVVRYRNDGSREVVATTPFEVSV